MKEDPIEEGLDDIYSDFEEDLEDDELSPEEAAFMHGYLEESED